MKMGVAIFAQNNRASGGYPQGYSDIDNPVNCLGNQERGQGQVRKFGNEHSLGSKSSGEIESCFHSLLSTCAANCVGKSNRAGVLIGREPMKQSEKG
jgi:hypothetical protein